MQSIDLSKVKKDNSNIRKFSDPLWRALRKERFRPAKPDAMTNQMAAEERIHNAEPGHVFNHDFNKFVDEKMTPREAKILRLFVFGGRISQAEIAEVVGVCQATVAIVLGRCLGQIKEEFYGVK